MTWASTRLIRLGLAIRSVFFLLATVAKQKSQKSESVRRIALLWAGIFLDLRWVACTGEFVHFVPLAIYGKKKIVR